MSSCSHAFLVNAPLPHLSLVVSSTRYCLSLAFKRTSLAEGAHPLPGASLVPPSNYGPLFELVFSFKEQ